MYLLRNTQIEGANVDLLTNVINGYTQIVSAIAKADLRRVAIEVLNDEVIKFMHPKQNEEVAEPKPLE